MLEVFASKEVPSSLHILLGRGGGGGGGTGKGDLLFRNGRRVFLVIKASIVWEWNGIVFHLDFPTGQPKGSGNFFLTFNIHFI